MSQPTPGAVLRGAVDLSALRNRPADTPEAAQGQQQRRLVVDVTDATFSQVLELSRTVPVVVDLWATWCEPCKQLSPILEKVVVELAGRLLLAKVDVDANPQLAQTFRAQSIPLVVALVAGQAMPLFTGAVAEPQVRDVLTQLLEVAARNGVTGTLPVDDAAEATDDEAAAVPPLHAQAQRALEDGDYAAAGTAYETALAQNPHDEDARVGLGRVHLLERVQGVDAQRARAAAATPGDIDAQLVVADLDLAGGHVDDAFTRLLDAFSTADPDERGRIRQRLLDLFETVGESDARVSAARRRLTSLLF